ncbi:serine hydrolase domain-containing protein [Georgenia wutianyii]|nr:serine hydrolase [Georgenia wutianyii]
MELRTTTVRAAVALLAVQVLVAAGVPAVAEADAPPEGQVVLDLSAEPQEKDEQSAMFYSPHGHATLRVTAEGRAAGQVRVNGEVVPGAAAALARGRDVVVDVSELVEAGENTVEVRLVRGEAYVSVDFPELVDVDPADVGVDPAVLARIDAAVESRLGVEDTDRYTGAVALVAHRGQVVYEKAFGDAQTHDGADLLAEPRPATVDTIFDMASITKVEATTAAVMRLVDEGRLDLDSRLDEHLPEFGDEKGAITVRQLITHRSGLWEWQPTYLHGRNQEEVLEFLTDLDLRYETGSQRRYSDIGFMLLGVIVERVSGQPLHEYVREHVHEPLGMTDTSFLPEAGLRDRIAATSLGNSYEYTMIETGSPYPIVGDLSPAEFTDWRDYTLVGEVNDGNAWYGWEGVAGHAGLFSTARDLAIYGQTLVNGGGYGDARLVSETTLAQFLAPQYDGGQVLGFWSDRLSFAGLTGGYGHNGFTGTEFLFDPERELVVVLLTNRLHPDRGPGSITAVWQEVVRAAVEATEQ